MRLLVITQVVDAEDPILGRHRSEAEGAREPLRRARRARRPGRARTTCRRTATIRSFGAPDTLRRGLRFVRALAPLPARPPRRCGARPHVSDLSRARRSAREADAPAAPALVHAPDRLADAPPCLEARVGADDRDADLVPAARIRRGDRPRNRRRGLPVPRRRTADGAVLDVLALGRYSAVKGYETVLRAVHRAAEAGIGARLTIHGPTLNDGERRQLASLERLRSELGLQESVHLREALPPAEARERLGPRRRARQQHGPWLRRQGRARGLRELRAGACVHMARAPPRRAPLRPGRHDGAGGTARRARRDGRRSGAPSSAAACGQPSSSATPRPPGPTRSCASPAKRPA